MGGKTDLVYPEESHTESLLQHQAAGLSYFHLQRLYWLVGNEIHVMKFEINKMFFSADK